MSNYKTETKCIQSGYTPDNGEPRVVPIYQSTTFKYSSSEQMGRLFDLEESGYFYTRLQNPTNDAVAAKICDLEGGVAAMLTSSGQAANFYAVMNIAQAGDHVVCASAIYGEPTTSLLTQSERWVWRPHLWSRTVQRRSLMGLFRRIPRLYLERVLQIRRWWFWILRSLPRLPMPMGFRLL